MCTLLVRGQADGLMVCVEAVATIVLLPMPDSTVDCDVRSLIGVGCGMSKRAARLS
jgi:hypothetical protein